MTYLSKRLHRFARQRMRRPGFWFQWLFLRYQGWRRERRLPVNETCMWIQEQEEDDCWSSCKANAFTLDEGTPSDNGMVFCCFCGKPIEQRPWEPEEAEDE